MRARIKGLTYGVYPNLSFLWQNATLRVSHPRAPGQVEYWSWSVVPTDAPPSVRRFTRDSYIALFGPGGLLEQEDSEAWAEQFRGSSIAALEGKPYYYGLGAGEESTHPQLPGQVGCSFNELYGREFYRRWRQELEQGLGLSKG